MSDEELHNMKEDLKRIKYKLDGNGSFGTFQKVDVMWRAHIWLLCGLSTVLGAAIVSLFHKLTGIK